MWARGRCTCGRADGTDVCGWTDETKAAATRIGSPNVVDGRRRTRRSFSLRVLLSSLSPHILVHTIWPSLRHTTHAYHIFRQPIRFGLWAGSFVSHRVKLCLWDRCSAFPLFTPCLFFLSPPSLIILARFSPPPTRSPPWDPNSPGSRPPPSPPCLAVVLRACTYTLPPSLTPRLS